MPSELLHGLPLCLYCRCGVVICIREQISIYLSLKIYGFALKRMYYFEQWRRRKHWTKQTGVGILIGRFSIKWLTEQGLCLPWCSVSVVLFCMLLNGKKKKKSHAEQPWRTTSRHHAMPCFHLFYRSIMRCVLMKFHPWPLLQSVKDPSLMQFKQTQRKKQKKVMNMLQRWRMKGESEDQIT